MAQFSPSLFILQKLFAAPKKLGDATFQDFAGFFRAVWWPFWILLGCGIAGSGVSECPFTARLVFMFGKGYLKTSKQVSKQAIKKIRK